jgi:dipeptide/tripeptide permease
MEAIFLVCSAGGPQLKRNPLGGTPHRVATGISSGDSMTSTVKVVLGIGCAAVALGLALYYAGVRQAETAPREYVDAGMFLIVIGFVIAGVGAIVLLATGLYQLTQLVRSHRRAA